MNRNSENREGITVIRTIRHRAVPRVLRVGLVLATICFLLGSVQAQPTPQAPFWASVSTITAFEKSENARLAAAQAAIESILRVKGTPTVDNTLEPFDDAILQLEDARYLAMLAQEAHPTEAFRNSGSTFLQKADRALDSLSLNRGVYDALVALDVSKADAVTQYYVQRRLLMFRLAGVDRSQADRERLQRLRDELAEAQSTFNRNINEDDKSILAKPVDLDGLPQDYIDRHKPQADGTVRITTDGPDYYPVMTYAKSDALRRQLLQANHDRGYPKNRDVLLQMMRLRNEIATLLGYPSWADYNAASKMTLNAKATSDFIASLDRVARPIAQREFEMLLAEKRKSAPDASDIRDDEVEYLRERLKRSTYNFDSSIFRSYLPAPAVKQGLIDTASRFFQLTFHQEDGVPAWAPNVETWDVLDKGVMVGRVYLDLQPRPGKYQGAENIPVLPGKIGKELPEAVVVANYATAGAGDPGLMEFDDVTELFHEFGHAVHRILSGSRLRWAGTNNRNLEFDFIEVPSQFFEKFPSVPVVLTSFARHYQTHQPIPADLMAQMNRASTFGRGMYALGSAGLCFLSFELYNRKPENVDLDAFSSDQLRRHTLLTLSSGVGHRWASFDHLADYSSAFYTYDWDKVIVEDFFNQFSRDNPFANDVASRYRHTVLEPGGSMSANDLVKNFLGRPQNMQAYQKWLEEEFHEDSAKQRSAALTSSTN
jgi:thimet oligopeptidase